MGRASRPTTNEDIMNILQEFMQMTSDGFVGIDNKFSSVEDKMGDLGARMSDLELSARDHGHQLTSIKTELSNLTSGHKAYLSDIADILNRLVKLEKQVPKLLRSQG